MSRKTYSWMMVALVGLVGCQSEAPVPAPAPAPPVAQQPQPDQPVLAEAGVGKQGQSLKNETGVGRMIAQPAMSLFTVQQRMELEVKIPQAMELYKATEGNYPKTHDEFMKKIIAQNLIKLPELPAGQEYKYHPDDAKLWVHPKGQ